MPCRVMCSTCRLLFGFPACRFLLSLCRMLLLASFLFCLNYYCSSKTTPRLPLQATTPSRPQELLAFLFWKVPAVEPALKDHVVGVLELEEVGMDFVDHSLAAWNSVGSYVS